MRANANRIWRRKVGMPQYSHLQAIGLSFYSYNLYSDVLKRWQGLGFGFLTTINTLLITPLILFGLLMADELVFTSDGLVKQNIENTLMDMASQMPPMRFEDGQMSVDTDQPVKIFAQIDGQQVLVLLIDEDASRSEVTASPSFMVLTRNTLFIRQQEDSFDEHPLEEFTETQPEPIMVDSTIALESTGQFLRWLEQNKAWLYVTFGLFSWAMAMLAMFIFRALQALLFGLGGFIIGAGLGRNIGYQAAVRLSAVCMTPAILLDVLFTIILRQGISTWLTTLLTIGYIGYAIYSSGTKHSAQPME